MPPLRANMHQHSSRVLLDMAECGRTIAHLFETASQTIIYSAFVCVLDTPMLGTQDTTITMKHLVHAAVRRGVKVQMRINPSCTYGNRVEDVEWLQSVGVDVWLVVGDEGQVIMSLVYRGVPQPSRSNRSLYLHI